jgi:2-dehydro-3-deoxygluconokinase
MLRLATPGYERFGQGNMLSATYGGGEANVAVSLANYGLPVSFVTRVPDNDIADACLRELRGFGVDVNDVIRGGNRLGIYFLETGAVSRGSKVIYDRAGSAIAQIEPGMIDWDKVLEGAGWFHWTGITPAISEGAAKVCLEAVKKCNEKGITVSCDLNYRKNLWKWGKKASEVMPDLVACTDIVLGNEEDAQMALGIKPEGVDVSAGKVDADAYLSVSKQIMARFPRCKKVITTLRGSINANHNTWKGVLYDVLRLPDVAYVQLVWPSYPVEYLLVGHIHEFLQSLVCISEKLLDYGKSHHLLRLYRGAVLELRFEVQVV